MACSPTPARAIALADGCLGLTEEHVEVLLDKVLPGAGEVTVTGLADGWGPVPASVARSIAARQGEAEWRFAVVDDEGQVLFDGITRRRPDRPSRASGDSTRQAQSGIVELHVPLVLLTDTRIREQHPGWSALLADLATQHAEQWPIDQDPTARFAGRPLRRRIQIHFQNCVFAGCRRRPRPPWTFAPRTRRGRLAAAHRTPAPTARPAIDPALDPPPF